MIESCALINRDHPAASRLWVLGVPVLYRRPFTANCLIQEMNIIEDSSAESDRH